MAPRCLTSPYCLIELEYARILGKRVIPINQVVIFNTDSRELSDSEADKETSVETVSAPPSKKKAGKKKSGNQKLGRPKGSHNRTLGTPELPARLLWIQALLRNLRRLTGTQLNRRYFVYNE
jgi:hypothetical protein